MKFIHSCPQAVEDYLATKGYFVFRLAVDGGQIEKVKRNTISDYSSMSYSLNGGRPESYIFASLHSEILNFINLDEAIRLSSDDDIIIIAYNDGGIISITKKIHAFQVGAASATWWSWA